MGCLSIGWLESILIDIVIIVAVVAIIRLFLPWFFSQVGLGDGGIILRVINIIVWAIVVIFVIIIVFSLLSCLVGGAGPIHLFPR